MSKLKSPAYDFYITIAIIGAVCFIIIGKLSGKNIVALYSCFGITLVIRLSCIKKDIHLKKLKKRAAVYEVVMGIVYYFF